MSKELEIAKMHIRPIGKGDEQVLLEIAKEGEPGIRANNRMIYFLAASVLSEYVFLGEINGVPVGYIFGIRDCTKPAIWLHQIVLKKSCRSKGYGGLFIQFLKNKAKKDGINHIELMVTPDNVARRLYSRAGFEEIEFNKGLNMFLYRMLLP